MLMNSSMLQIFGMLESVLISHSNIDKTKILMTNGSLMKVNSISECSTWSILQYFWPALSDNLLWKTIFVCFPSGHLRQVLLYLSHEQVQSVVAQFV